jgi:uncharacterized protein (DUF1697 family)
MTYIALLRGINVGGNNKIEMARLKAAFEQLGFTDVKTYINSGNVVFTASETSTSQLCRQVEAAIEKDFGLAVPTLIIDANQLAKIAAAIPADWTNDQTMKCDVLFLWSALDQPEVLEQLPINPKIEDVKYTAGAVIWRVDRTHQPQSGLIKIIGTKLYGQVTVRNCNTVRKLAIAEG